MSEIKNELPTQIQLSRRKFLTLVTSKSVELSILGSLLEAGVFELADSPITRFFLTGDYTSRLPRSLQLLPEQVRVRNFGIDSSYVSGEGGEAPIEIAKRTVNEAQVGEWEVSMGAVSGAYLEDVPEQLVILSPYVNSNETGIITADGGYNSLSRDLLDDTSTKDAIAYLLDHLSHFSLFDLPKIKKQLDILCGSFFYLLDKTGEKLGIVLEDSIKILHASKLQVYKYPPLEYAHNLVHIPPRTDPEDKRFSIRVRGNSGAELLAKRISILGSNKTEREAENLYINHPGIEVVTVNLRRILTQANYDGSLRKDEHPDFDGYKRISAQQLIEITQGGQDIYAKVGRRMR